MRLYKCIFTTGMLFFLFFLPKTIFAHPYYISLSEIQVDTEKKTVNMSCRMFTDDLEQAIRKLYVTYADLKNGMNKDDIELLISRYITEHFSLSVSGTVVPLSFLGYEFEDESVWSYLEGNLPPITEKKAAIKNTLLFDFLAEQTNMVHIVWNGERKSTKLLNPASGWEVSF